MKFLAINCNPKALKVLSALIEREWPEAQLVSAEAEEEAVIKEALPDMVILIPVSLEDGLRTLSQIRGFQPSALVIVVSSLNNDRAIVEYLNAGADDYIPTQVSPEVLLAKMKALLRRCEATPSEVARLKDPRPEDHLIICGDWVIDPLAHKVTVGGKLKRLTPTEFKLLLILAENMGRVVTKPRLKAWVWPKKGATDTDLKLYIRYLRMKLERDPENPEMIHTVRGVGYILRYIFEHRPPER